MGESLCVRVCLCCTDATALAANVKDDDNDKGDDNDDNTYEMWTSTPSEHKGLHDVRQGRGLYSA